MKKPSIAVVAGASTSEDVCPWESAPEPRSRKNSIQMDSGSSSSDVSVAVTDVSDRLRRTCGLTQQNTLDGTLSSRKLSTASFIEPRRASVSVPITTTESSRRNLSSFEDTNVSEASAPSAPIIPSDTDNKNEEVTSSTKTIEKSNSLVKTCSVTGANAPIISVSSVMDDTTENPSELYEEQLVEAGCSSQQPLAPLAEPDSESPASEQPPEPIPEAEAKSNDVCPWEDE